MRTVSKGIREQGKEIDSYNVVINLPKRFGNRGKTFEFNLGTVYGLDNAIEVREKAEKIKEEYFDYEEDCLYYLNELKENIKAVHMTKKSAASVLKEILYEHRCNSSWIDWDSDYPDDIEKQNYYNAKENALEIAIKYLER